MAAATHPKIQAEIQTQLNSVIGKDRGKRPVLRLGVRSVSYDCVQFLRSTTRSYYRLWLLFTSRLSVGGQSAGEVSIVLGLCLSLA